MKVHILEPRPRHPLLNHRHRRLREIDVDDLAAVARSSHLIAKQDERVAGSATGDKNTERLFQIETPPVPEVVDDGQVLEGTQPLGHRPVLGFSSPWIRVALTQISDASFHRSSSNNESEAGWLMPKRSAIGLRLPTSAPNLAFMAALVNHLLVGNPEQPSWRAGDVRGQNPHRAATRPRLAEDDALCHPSQCRPRIYQPSGHGGGTSPGYLVGRSNNRKYSVPV